MNKTSIKTRFTVVSSKSLVKWVAKAFTSASQLFIRRLKVILITKDFFQESILFGSHKTTDL